MEHEASPVRIKFFDRVKGAQQPLTAAHSTHFVIQCGCHAPIWCSAVFEMQLLHLRMEVPDSWNPGLEH